MFFAFQEDELGRESLNGAVNCPVFITGALLFLSFMSSYIWGEHKCKTHDLAKDKVSTR